MTQLWFVSLGLIWGTNFCFMKLAVSALSPLQIVWARVLCGALAVVAWSALRRELKAGDLRHAHHFVAMALLANVPPFYFLVRGTQLLGSGVAGVVSGAIPLMTALLALLLLGSLSYAAAFVYARRFVQPLGIGPVALAAYQTAFASLILTGVTDLHGLSAAATHPGAILAAAIGLGLLGTGIAYILYYRLIDRMGAVTASSVTYLPPVVALAIGVSLMHDRLSPWQWTGTLLILGGMYLLRKSHEKRERA